MSDPLLDVLALRLAADRYALAVDTGDGSLFARQFTADGVLEAPRGRFAGHDALSGVPAMMKLHYERTHHAVTTMVPAIEGDRATADTYCLARHYRRAADGGERCYEMTVRYEDVFCRQAGEWKLASRRLVLVGDATFSTGREPAKAAAGDQA